MRWPKRQHDGIFGGGSLQFEIEFATETFAQSQAPGAIQTAAKGRMNDQLHAATVVEETFENDVLLRGDHTECSFRGSEIFGDLLSG